MPLPTRAGGDENPKAQEASAERQRRAKLVVTVGKVLIIDSPMKIQRISVANGDLVGSGGGQSEGSADQREGRRARLR